MTLNCLNLNSGKSVCASMRASKQAGVSVAMRGRAPPQRPARAVVLTRYDTCACTPSPCDTGSDTVTSSRCGGTSQGMKPSQLGAWRCAHAAVRAPAPAAGPAPRRWQPAPAARPRTHKRRCVRRRNAAAQRVQGDGVVRTMAPAARSKLYQSLTVSLRRCTGAGLPEEGAARLATRAGGGTTCPPLSRLPSSWLHCLERSETAYARGVE